MKRLNVILAIAALAAIAASFLTAHPCEIEGRIDAACMRGLK